MKETQDLESIKSKILKLHALAESGNTHEAKNAKAMLEKWLENYGLSLEEILSEKDEEKWHSFKYRYKWEKDLLFHIYFMVKDVSTCKYHSSNSEVSFKLTAYEFAEMSNYFDWHKNQLGKELKNIQQDFASAYYIKHGLVSSGKDYEPKQLSDDDLKRLAKTLALLKTVEDTTYHKLLTR